MMEEDKNKEDILAVKDGKGRGGKREEGGEGERKGGEERFAYF